MMVATSLVVVVDDDESVRESLPDLLIALGYDVDAFGSAEAFMAADIVEDAGCLILDIALPGMKGPELQDELARRGIDLPIVFITANRDPAMRARLIARGATEVLFKPFSDTALLGAITAALAGR
jgi:FixJ family two-component response regulator